MLEDAHHEEYTGRTKVASVMANTAGLNKFLYCGLNACLSPNAIITTARVITISPGLMINAIIWAEIKEPAGNNHFFVLHLMKSASPTP